MAGHRLNRTAEDIRREIAAVLRELKDPRIQGQLLTVVRVEVSRDASFAKVYVSAMEGLEMAKLAVTALKSASGLIRREVGGRLGLRKAPELKFVADNSTEYASGIAKTLNTLEEQRHEYEQND